MKFWIEYRVDILFSVTTMWAALACAFAESKKRNGLAWSLAGVFGGIIGVFVIACQPPLGASDDEPHWSPVTSSREATPLTHAVA